MLRCRLKLPSASQAYITRYPTEKDSCQVSDNHYSVRTHPHSRPETSPGVSIIYIDLISPIMWSSITVSFASEQMRRPADREALFIPPLVSSPSMKLYPRPKQTDPPGAPRQHLPLKPTASSCVTSPQERRVGSLIVFTRPSHNLAAPYDTGAGRHQSLPALHLPGKRETSRRMDSFTENSSGR